MAKKNRKKESKEKLYKPTDSNEGEQILNEDVAHYATNRAHETEEDDLTEKQLRELDEADKEIERGETISWEDLKKEMAAWRSK